MAAIIAKVLMLSMLFTGLAFSAKQSDLTLVEISDDAAGMGLKRVTISLFADGRVMKEGYDFSSPDSKNIHSVVLVRSLSRDQLERLLEKALVTVEGLPEFVNEDEGFVLDSESKRIFVLSAGRSVRSIWHGYGTSRPSTDTQRFEVAWREIETLLYGDGT